MSVYLHTIIAAVSLYIAYLWGRNMTRGQIAAEVAEGTLARLERGGFIKYKINKKTGETEFVMFK